MATTPITITGLKGKQYAAGTQAYGNYEYSYAWSSHGIDHDMNPGLIVQPKDKNDIARVIQYAKQQKIAVSIRTGGHQYSGACSTGPTNIMLDLKNTFTRPDDLVRLPDKDGVSFVRTSVSWSLGAFNAFLAKNGCFVPHGQCTDVHLGGHVQTGGYGQLGRSFGLLGDHVRSLEIVDHGGKFVEVTKQNTPELFYGILGGSPGNFGVLCHFTIEVHRDVDYAGSLGLKSVFLYNPKTLKHLLDILVKFSDNPDTPRNYDLCISVLSSSFPLLKLFPVGGEADQVDAKFKLEHPEIYGEDGQALWPRTIVVYAQWVKLRPNDVPDMSWFESLARGAFIGGRVMVGEPMSYLTGQWLFRNPREFKVPYNKRTYLTKSTTLGKDGWVDWVVARINEIVEPAFNECWLAVQLQCLGGKYAKFTTNADNGTSYSWRDSSFVCVLDCFHSDDAKRTADQWQYVNDREGVLEKGIFSKQDRRVLWGSYGEYDLDRVWPCYYEDETKYKRLQAARQAADPDGVFTPNPFCVRSASQPAVGSRL